VAFLQLDVAQTRGPKRMTRTGTAGFSWTMTKYFVRDMPVLANVRFTPETLLSCTQRKSTDGFFPASPGQERP
jgi:hypothetical protein